MSKAMLETRGLQIGTSPHKKITFVKRMTSLEKLRVTWGDGQKWVAIENAEGERIVIYGEDPADTTETK